MKEYDEAVELARVLDERRCRIVFAESCTAGLACATLAMVPGISKRLCGAFVTYRDSAKREMLGVPKLDLETEGAVSVAVARFMAEGALRRTPEARIAVSITGHLGPEAPAELDGLAFIGLARRGDKSDLSDFDSEECFSEVVSVRCPEEARRPIRQKFFAAATLRYVRTRLENGFLG